MRWERSTQVRFTISSNLTFRKPRNVGRLFFRYPGLTTQDLRPLTVESFCCRAAPPEPARQASQVGCGHSVDIEPRRCDRRFRAGKQKTSCYSGRIKDQSYRS